MRDIDYKAVRELLTRKKKILITTHTNPDGDAIGSALALYLFFKNRGDYEVHAMVPNNYPGFLKWLNGSDSIIVFDEKKKLGRSLIKEADVIFSLDYNSFDRVETFSKEIEEAQAVKILIDHHPQPKDYFDFSFSTTETSSTAEMIFDFIVELGGLSSIDKAIAENVYTGIVTDTGSFSYLCNYAKTYHAVAELIKKGVDGERIHNLIYDNASENRLRLLGFCLSERLVVLEEYNTAYIYLSQKDMERFNYQVGDTEGVVNYPLSMGKIHFAALFRERNNKIRISLRSKGNFSVNTFARNHFYGGGHKNASGADSFSSLDETLKKFESVLPQYKEDLKRSMD